MWGIVRDITQRKMAEQELKISQHQLRRFSLHLQEQLESEKKYMASEFHDELGQMLTGLKIDLSWLAGKLPAHSEPLAQKARSMLDLIDETDKVMRRIVSDLRPTILDDLGLPTAVKWQVQQFKARTGIRCWLRIDPEDFCLERERSVDIFRIAQEALTNIYRHSGATTVRLWLKSDKGIVSLRVTDNGIGITGQQACSSGSFGIMGMRERAGRWRGSLKITGTPGKVTVVKLSIPAPGKEDLGEPLC
jgi:signal transduction histidine kinase